MKKQLLLLLLALISVTSASAYDFSAENDEGVTIYYDKIGDSNNVEVVDNEGMNSYSGVVNIPATVIHDGTIYSVTKIGAAFYICGGLTSVTIPESVTTIGDYAFFNSSSLTSLTIPDSVTSIGKFAFECCIGLTSVTIPNSVTTISESVFQACHGLTSVIIPESVTSIGMNAFSGCHGLTSLTIPESVTSIGMNAFSGCHGLTSVTIPNSVTTISESVFRGCSGLTSMTIPTSVTSIGQEAFYGCSALTSVTIPNSVTSIGQEAFYGCSALTSVTIPNSVSEIGSSAFSGCSGLKTLHIDDADTELSIYSENNKYYPFKDCNIENLYVGRSLSSWEALCVTSNLKEVEFGNSVTLIPNNAFEGCWRLTSVTIPKSFTEIGEQAFKGCSNLYTINACPVVPPICGTDAFDGVDKESCILYVPEQSIGKYKSLYQWKDFLNIEGSDFSNIENITAESVTLNKSSLSLNVGQTETLVATVAPENTTDKTVTWTSSDTSVATVDANGLVTAVAAGTATITATCGNVSATCDVTVTIPAGMGLNTDDAAQARYFDLNGREVAGDKLVPGLYIKVVNGQTQKVVVK